MFLQSLVLKNIRSYKEATLHFPKGSILLSGDVGSGKTTLLLAVEFALFGILRSELAAASLLRHGEDEGFVRLSFSIDNDMYVVERTLKWDKKTVKQGSGSLIINNQRESLTPVELKARVLAILGYSNDLLTKTKSLVFRYTVYTPQEAMKHILFEDADARLETLRKVFAIDQYKRMQENGQILLRELRAEEKAHSLQLDEFPHKEKELEDLEKQRQLLLVELDDVKKKSEEQALALTRANEATVKAQLGLDDYYKAKQSLSSKSATSKQCLFRSDELKVRLANVQKELRILESHEKKDPEKLKLLLTKNEEQTTIIQDRVQKAREKLLGAKMLHSQAVQAKHKFSALAASCPLCEQEIAHDHKSNLLKTQETIIRDQEQVIKQMESFILEAEKKRQGISEQSVTLRAEILFFSQLEEKLRAKQEVLLTLTQDIVNNEERFKEAKLEEQHAEAVVLRLEKNIVVFKEMQSLALREQEKFHALQLAQVRVVSTESALQRQVASLTDALQRMCRHRQAADALKSRAHWLKEFFLPLADDMEKAVFASIHHEFSALFSSWFAKIIDDELMKVSLDKGFSPLVSLNGYDTEIEALSGGEKTALALAYRLSLTQVINDFLGTGNTRDVLILDEPTDGFSALQLERMRDVLHDLRVGQLILVSHEEQMEGFVEHIIRVRKDSQESSIEQ
jgi:exonuclease SbcC